MVNTQDSSIVPDPSTVEEQKNPSNLLQEPVASELPVESAATDSAESPPIALDSNADATPQPTKKMTSPPTSPGRIRHRVTVREDIYYRLHETATSQGRPISHLATEVLEAYLQSLG